MINGKCIGIDARMAEMSGIGTYIQHQLGQGIYDYAVGDETIIRKYDKEVRVIPFNARIYGPDEQFRFPKKEIQKANIALMHFPHYNVPLTYNEPYVVTVHDLTHILIPECLNSKIKTRYARILMDHTLKHSKRVLTVSENTKKDIQDIFGTDERMVRIAGNAADAAFRIIGQDETERLTKPFNIPNNKKVLLYVGNLKPHKNLPRLLEAFKAINREDTILVLAGRAFDSLSLKEQEETLHIQQSVIYTGEVTKEELVALYNRADVFVFPSLYEGFGIPPLEAMACGTPVAAANNSSIPEVVGDAAVLFDAKDTKQIKEAIQQILDNEDLKQECIRKGTERVRLFSWDNVTATIKQTLTEALNT